MPIKLPKDPKDHDYEDQVAALLTASGYYLETRLVLKAGTEEVLEFDALATPVNNYQSRKVVEVKSGAWGIADIFKLYGQTLYTRHQGAWLIHKQPVSATKQEAVGELCAKMPVTTHRIDFQDKSGSSAEIPIAVDMEDKFRHLAFAVAWWSRIADRLAQARFKTWAKSDTSGAAVVQQSRTYAAQLANGLFKESPLRRANAIYDAYKEAPKLTSSLISFVAEQSKGTVKDVRSSVFDTGERMYLQYVAALEHRARIAIVKNAHDAVLVGADEPMVAAAELGLNLGYKAFMPATFQAGMQALEEHPHADQVAYFLQVFIEVLGGFYFANDEDDLRLVAALTGVPIDQVPAMAAMLDKFFPIPNGWVHHGNGGLNFVKGVPAYLRGAGCFARQFHRGRDWCSTNSAAYTTVRWYKALYGLLESNFSAEPLGK